MNNILHFENSGSTSMLLAFFDDPSLPLPFTKGELKRDFPVSFTLTILLSLSLLQREN
jgi:hypothetical protein